MMPGSKQSGKLLRSVNRGVDRPAQNVLSFSQHRDQLGKPRVADDEEIDIAARHFFAACDGTVNECAVDA